MATRVGLIGEKGMAPCSWRIRHRPCALYYLVATWMATMPPVRFRYSTWRNPASRNRVASRSWSGKVRKWNNLDNNTVVVGQKLIVSRP